MGNAGIRRVCWSLVAAGALLLLPSAAFADGPDYVVFFGSSHGAGAQLDASAPAEDDTLRAGEIPMSETATSDGTSLAMLGLGLVGSEGTIRAGGEVFTLLGVSGDASGYTSAVTFAGLDNGRAFTQGGLGIGTYWGADRIGTLAAIAGNAHAQVGIRITRQFIALGRGDLIVNSVGVSSVATFGLQWIPGG